MVFIFGWNHFRIKTFTAQELGIPHNEVPEPIELRQKYFHLFWIPFFGLGKKWAIRNANNKLGQLPIDHEAYLQSHDFKVRSPWYTFTGPILIVVGLIVGNIVVGISQSIAVNESNNRFESQIRDLNKKYQRLEKADYLNLVPTTSTGKTYPMVQVYEIKPGEITFKRLKTTLDSYELSARKTQYYFSQPSHLDTISISKNKLEAAINRKYEYAGVDLFGDGTQYIVRRIYTLNGPIITDRKTGSYGQGQMQLDFMNYGWPVVLVNIENKSGEQKWNMEYPVLVGSADNDYDENGKLILKFATKEIDSPYEFVMTFQDSLNQMHKYNVKGYYVKKTITKL